MPKIGAHVSAAVSLDFSIQRAGHIGAQASQIFVSPPQQWQQTKHSEEEIKKYLQTVKERGVSPNFIHSTYLVNLAAQDPEHLKKSVDWLIYAMELAKGLGAEGVIVHVGSHKGLGLEAVLPQIAESIKTVLRSSGTNKPYLILENCAGSGGTIGQKFSELGQILKATQDDQVKICLDTQHAFAAGYDLRTKATIESTLDEFEQEIGLDKLVVIHANDSKTELGSNRDRHENIGEGFIGKEGFKNLLNHPSLSDLPFILEVPGFADAGPDKENIDILNSLIA